MKNIKHQNSQMYNRLNQQLFDIMEISESDQNMQVMCCNNQYNHQLFNDSTLQKKQNMLSKIFHKTAPKIFFWDQSSVRDVKLLKISNNQYGKRNIEQILIQTVSCDNIITANSHSFVDFLFK
ncbi:Hypothetical_protein [Hexamita inflata]|uniref:Hypothetical_protein n=1 Tax=Hexamita inflata TaxID=28002 RepID=A0AA86RBG3_9EUKA|nr:Hypothetical protein HINF_LOCUS62989 [Hexamita inflata]